LAGAKLFIPAQHLIQKKKISFLFFAACDSVINKTEYSFLFHLSFSTQTATLDLSGKRFAKLPLSKR